MKTKLITLFIAASVFVGCEEPASYVPPNTATYTTRVVVYKPTVTPYPSALANNVNSIIGSIADSIAIESARLLIDAPRLLRDMYDTSGSGPLGEGPLVANFIAYQTDTIAYSAIAPGTYDRELIKTHTYSVQYDTMPIANIADFADGTTMIVSGTVYSGKTATTFVYKTKKPMEFDLAFGGAPVTLDVGNTYLSYVYYQPNNMFHTKQGLVMDPRDPANAMTIDEMIGAAFTAQFDRPAVHLDIALPIQSN